MKILILILATYRIARLLAEEAGPFDVFGWLREKAGVGFDDVGNLYGSNELARGLMCVWCNSVWVGLALAIGHYRFHRAAFVGLLCAQDELGAGLEGLQAVAVAGPGCGKRGGGGFNV